MAQNRFSRYLLYSIGEIVLVVIGILIALQINNWNEDQKNRKLEKNMLENLVETLEQNNSLLTSRVRSIAKYRESGAVIISAIENNLTNPDSLKDYYHLALMNTSDIQLSDVGYTVIKNNGLGIIRNQLLKKEIMIFFEETQPKLQYNLSWGSIDLADREKLIDENFIQTPNEITLSYRLFDAKNLFKNNYFVALIYKTDTQRGFFSMVIAEHLKENERIMNMIKDELN